MKSKSILVLAVLVFSSVAKAETITIFDSNAIISDGDIYDTVVVQGDGTVVDMTGGNVNSVITMNASTFNMSGGDITIKVSSCDTSELNLSNGNIQTMYCYGESKVNILGSVSVNADIYPVGSSVLSISDNATVSTIEGRENALIKYRWWHCRIFTNTILSSEGKNLRRYNSKNFSSL